MSLATDQRSSGCREAARGSAWTKWILLTAAVLAWLVSMALSKKAFIYEALLYHRLVQLDKAFHDAIAGADRLVVRKGGFGCCSSIDDDEVLFVVTNRAELQDMIAHLRIMPIEVTNSFLMGETASCGYPGMDWYKGRHRVALTAVHEGGSVRWKGFSTARILGIKVDCADANLDPDSRAWFRTWLAERGVADPKPPPAPGPG